MKKRRMKGDDLQQRVDERKLNQKHKDEPDA